MKACFLSKQAHLSILINDGNELGGMGVEHGVLCATIGGVGVHHRAACAADRAAQAGLCIRSLAVRAENAESSREHSGVAFRLVTLPQGIPFHMHLLRSFRWPVMWSTPSSTAYRCWDQMPSRARPSTGSHCAMPYNSGNFQMTYGIARNRLFKHQYAAGAFKSRKKGWHVEGSPQGKQMLPVACSRASLLRAQCALPADSARTGIHRHTCDGCRRRLRRPSQGCPALLYDAFQCLHTNRQEPKFMYGLDDL